MTTFKHGDEVIATIGGEEVRGEIICNGSDYSFKRGDKIYALDNNFESYVISNLRLATREYEEDDILNKILQIVGELPELEPSDIHESGKLSERYRIRTAILSLYTPELVEVDGKKYSKEEILKLTPIL